MHEDAPGDGRFKTSAGDTLISVCKVDDVPVGEMRSFSPAGLPAVAIYNVAGEFFATADRCTHGGASLTADGALSDYIVECSWHFGSFDVRTGEGVAAPCRRPLRTYRVVLSDGGIWLALTRTQALEAGL